ncbi:hypothetical protein [Sinobaca sp. H24]|uniref:hypothetical protein n=1 Tax=Sinobaca sp. H24 TaxID=2923376 RepID=UPI00207A33C8|nr:hypothetical protein [Sinobaca sp. H24]
MFQTSLLPTAEDGSLRVMSVWRCRECLVYLERATSVTIDSYPDLPKNGVYAIRQAPILKDNITAFFRGPKYRHLRHRKKYMAILSIGAKKVFL